MDSRRPPSQTDPRRVFVLLLRIAPAFAWCLVSPLLPLAQETRDVASLTYTKILKGSFPEYLVVTVDSNGLGTYEGRKLTEPSHPRPLKLTPSTTKRLFELAGRLDNFQSIDLESHKKVANLGLKTLTYEGRGQQHRAEFNYTVRREAQELTDLFEKIASVMQHVAMLEFAIKYDHLSLPKELRQIQIDLENKALAEPELLIPALEQIVHNPRFLHLAQVRAQNILHRIHNYD